MAGKIVADTLEHSTAGSIATNYVVEGSAKAWVNFDGTGTIAARDSLNLSSLTDAGGGNYGITVSSAFGNSDYMAAGMSQDTGAGDFVGINGSTPPTTTAFRFYNFNNTSSVVDTARVFVAFHGDLA